MTLHDFLEHAAPVIQVRLTGVRGSSPREAGTEMFVIRACDSRHDRRWAAGIHGHRQGPRHAAGGRDCRRGWTCRSAPRSDNAAADACSLPLHLMGDAEAKAALAAETSATRGLAACATYLGAGHVGRALATFFQALPVRSILIDSRAEELALAEARVENRLTAMPEADIRSAPAGSAFVVLTHDHALDFLLTAEALARRDAAYVGMIGSATKRAEVRPFLPGLFFGCQSCGTDPARSARQAAKTNAPRSSRPLSWQRSWHG